MANKKTAITISIISVIVVLGIGILVTLNLVNKKVERDLETKITGFIQSSGLKENIIYKDIDVNAVKGKVALNQLKLILPDNNIKINTDYAYIIIPPMEAVSISKNPKNANLSKIQMGIENLTVSVPVIGMNTSVNSLKFSITGNLNQQMFQRGLTEFLTEEHSLKLNEMMELADVTAELAVDKINSELRSGILPYLEMMDLHPAASGCLRLIQDGYFHETRTAPFRYIS